jgi:hypothetical protein
MKIILSNGTPVAYQLKSWTLRVGCIQINTLIILPAILAVKSGNDIDLCPTQGAGVIFAPPVEEASEMKVMFAGAL